MSRNATYGLNIKHNVNKKNNYDVNEMKQYSFLAGHYRVELIKRHQFTFLLVTNVLL